MTTLSVRGINENVKKQFEKAVVQKYGKKHTVMGLEVEKALVFYLTNGKSVDPGDLEMEPQAPVAPVEKKPAHTHNHSGDDRGNITMFGKAFVDNFGDNEQVSFKDIRKLATVTQGVIDERSIQKRVNYLVDLDYIKPINQNVFEVKIEKSGF
ncbi:hypothetical protein [Methanobacterium congolense]|uniref:Uncharacterized protein n=1 Tax=Methanobacterium congolense TaxID=118062 RepID=A0A1D3L5V1_9EURY|nr:hypothetical protein [Methanobacterium congolense]SCG86928.1 hypothetical protein MCBB_PMCBBP0018 [Methanobacterium congolense]